MEVETDHKPLEIILKKPLHQAPPRLQKMIMTVQKYPIKVHYRPGKELIIADTLSRAYISDPTPDLMTEEFEVNIIHSLPISETYRTKLEQYTLQDSVLQKLKQTVENGWPQNKRDAPVAIHTFWNYRDEISTQNGIMFRGPKVIVPKEMQSDMLRLIHSSHLGAEKCKRRARDILFWPSMIQQIENMISTCRTCNKYRRKNVKEPLMHHPVPK